jgi:uncharacterized protein (DUF697 family)
MYAVAAVIHDCIFVGFVISGVVAAWHEFLTFAARLGSMIEVKYNGKTLGVNERAGQSCSFLLAEATAREP